MKDMLGTLIRKIVDLPLETLGTLCDLVEKLLSETGQRWLVELRKFLRKETCWYAERIRIIDKNTILVNLDASLKLPFNGAEIEFQIGSGWVKLEKRKDGLYVDGCKVILYLPERQKNGKVIKGYELRDELTDKPVLHPNILDALLDYSQIIPEDWKWKKWKLNKDERISHLFIFFWAVVFCDPSSSYSRPLVRCLYFDGGKWYSSYDYLDEWFDINSIALCVR